MNRHIDPAIAAFWLLVGLFSCGFWLTVSSLVHLLTGGGPP
jgi:hypothetical protein